MQKFLFTHKFSSIQNIKNIRHFSKSVIHQSSTQKKLPTHQIILNLLASHKRCQLSTHKRAGFPSPELPNTSNKLMDSTIVPYGILEKKNEDLKHFVFKHYDIIICFNKKSVHIENLKLEGQLASMTFGHTEQLTRFFKESGRYPPRGLFASRLEPIEDETENDSIWNKLFAEHPNVSIPKSDCRLYRATDFKSFYYTDMNGNMEGLDDLSKILNAKYDEMSPVINKYIEKYNNNPEALDRLARNGFNLNLMKKFIYSIDRYSIKLLGKANKVEDWCEYILDFGKEIFTEEQLMDELLQMME